MINILVVVAGALIATGVVYYMFRRLMHNTIIELPRKDPRRMSDDEILEAMKDHHK